MEIWQEIPSVPGYEASSTGRVRRRDGRPISQHWNNGRRIQYLRVQVWIDGKRAWRRVNRLVCEAFHGAPQDGEGACHIDSDPGNNSAANLGWGTPRANYEDQLRRGTANLPRKNASPADRAARRRELARMRASEKKAENPPRAPRSRTARREAMEALSAEMMGMSDPQLARKIGAMKFSTLTSLTPELRARIKKLPVYRRLG